jgi:hypothetical protein
MDRDIDYAAIAVRKAIAEKFGDKADLAELTVVAGERHIELRHGESALSGTRDELQAAIREASAYEDLWRSRGQRRSEFGT